MPGHYRSPYGYSYYNPTGKEQAALTIGSLLAGALAASSGQSKGDAVRKGIAGTMAGYGSGYKNYQDLMGDAFARDLQTKGYGQRIKEYEDSMGLNREKFAEEKRQYEETDKPERLARTNYYNEREATPVDYNKIRDERTKRRLDIRAKRADLAKPPPMPDIGNYAKLKAQLAGLKSPQNMDYLGMPANERAATIADLENAIRVMGQHQPELIPPQQKTQQIPQQDDVLARYRNDPDMQGTTIGELTDKGYEVFRNGKPVGHYQ